MSGLMDEGEQWALGILLRGVANTADLYVGLYTNGTDPLDTATLASGLTEVSTSGSAYARILIERSTTGWPTLALASGDYQATSKSIVFATPTSAWGTVYGTFLTTTASGTAGLLLATYPLFSPRVVVSGNAPLSFVLNQKAA